jgi:serine/threonine-protein kinase
VFEAEHLVTRATVALKTLTRRALDHAPSHARLLREARVLGAIRHPNVVRVQDAGQCAKHGPFIVLELLEGRPLDGILAARGSLAVDQAVALVVQLCDALDAVHQQGIVHRDVKPSNLLVQPGRRQDRLVLVDFGVAMVDGEDSEADVDVSEKLTKEGELLGTVEYMSPEQIGGRDRLEARSDVYALGVVLYECLTGDVPLSGGPMAVMAKLAARIAPPPLREARPDVPVAIAELVHAALEPEPARRIRSASAFAAACAAAFGGTAPKLRLLEARDDRVQSTATASGLETDTAEVAAHPGAAPAMRRQHVRAPYVTPVRIVLEDGTAVDGRTEDISEGGVLIVTHGACPSDAPVKLRMPLPTSGRVVSLTGHARWSRTHRTQRAVGVELVDVPDEVRGEIRRYVEMMST